MIGDHTDIRPGAFYPVDDCLQNLLGVGLSVAYQSASNRCVLPDVHLINLGDRYIELAVKPVEQWLQPAALLLERRAARKV